MPQPTYPPGSVADRVPGTRQSARALGWRDAWHGEDTGARWLRLRQQVTPDIEAAYLSGVATARAVRR